MSQKGLLTAKEPFAAFRLVVFRGKAALLPVLFVLVWKDADASMPVGCSLVSTPMAAGWGLIS